MAKVGSPIQYGYAERLMRTLKDEEVDLDEYRDYRDVYQHIGQFIEDVYMHKRVHSALGLFLEEDPEYARRLMRAGVPTGLHIYPGAYHGFRMVADAQVTQAATRDQLVALKRAFDPSRREALHLWASHS